jgi:3-deoxy-manno-octulosonate cytidylyltransferase (CMP-KDO synthetase)
MILGIIPARYGSTRLPGKMLADIGGKPLLWHTWSRASRAKRLDRLVIAAGDEKIAAAAREFGAEVVEAYDDVPSGSDRVWTAYCKMQIADCRLQNEGKVGNPPQSAIPNPQSPIILNIQGDEPQIDPIAIDAAVDALLNDPEAGVGTVAAPITTEAEYLDPAVVKLVLDVHHRALYFSRSPIPHGINLKSKILNLKLYRHMGLYAFRSEVLEKFTQLPQSPLELTERLEQLRLLEAGVKFAVGIVERAGMEVNTPQDLEIVRSAYQSNQKPQ